MSLDNRHQYYLPTDPITLSVAAPAYNEAGSIYAVVTGWREFLFSHPHIAQFEIIVCNDGSQDETALILDYLHSQYPEIKPCHLKANQGASVALSQAIKKTQFDWVLLMDADGQFPIENLNSLLTEMKNKQAPVVLGIREKQDSRYARMGSKLSGSLCNLLHGVRLKDFNSACKLVAGPLLRSLTLETKGMNYSTEITSRLLERKVPVAEVEIIHRPRFTGSSKMKRMKGTLDRLLFVIYIGLRQLLLKLEIIQNP